MRKSNAESFTWFDQPAYLHISKLAGLEDSTNQASKAARKLTFDFTGVNQPLYQEIIPNLFT